MARVLVIDDNDLIREMLRDLLEGDGHEVMEAPNGREGNRLYRESPTDVIITDIMMPEEDGLETIRNLTRDYSDVKIIAISGGDVRGRLEYLSFAQEWGALRTFSKPFNPSDILNAVAELAGNG